MVEDLCIISGCILSGKCAVKPGPADIHIDSYRQTYSLHKTSECITDRGNDGDSANHITASLRYRIYFADFADRIACDYNCIGNEEYVRTMDSNAAFLCNAIVTAIMGTVSGYLYERKQIVKKQTIYDVEVAQQGRKLTLKALLDTGNGLREPISGRPVSIIERDVYDTLCHQTIQERYRVIPYHSIGKEHGILQGTEVDELIIWREDEPYVQKKAVIALYEGKLSGNGSYQMILHTGLL